MGVLRYNIDEFYCYLRGFVSGDIILNALKLKRKLSNLATYETINIEINLPKSIKKSLFIKQ